MEDEAELDLGFGSAPSQVSLTPFSPIAAPSAGRLSACFAGASRPVAAARRLAWVSLEGRLVNAEEASSARVVNGGLAPPEAAAWQLFSPVHRFLLVAVIGAAAAESKKSGEISRLQKSVQLRDQVLSTMQQKLDNLCEQLNNAKEFFGVENVFVSSAKDLNPPDYEHLGNSAMKTTGEDGIVHYKTCLANVAEQEERRMSDLSDWASSVTSASEIQMNNLAIEQDVYNLRRDCDDKDAVIKELTDLLQCSDMAGSKRISEMEDIIRRKNTTITRLKKDIVVLEQKLMNLARLRRSSFCSSEPPKVEIPHMVDNLLYDMDSTTGPSSSSDSESSRNKTRVRSFVAKTPNSVPKSRSVSPLKEISMNRKSEGLTSARQRPLSASGDTKRANRRLHLSTRKDSTPHKRWV